MKRFSRDTWLALGLLIALVAITALAIMQNATAAAAPPLASFSSAPEGARALWRWLAALHYQPDNRVGAEFAVPYRARLVFILEPSELVTEADWQQLDPWVEKGGTLVLAGEGASLAQAARHFAFDLHAAGTLSPTLALQTPLLASPPIITSVTVRARSYFTTLRTDYVAYLAVEPGPVLVSFPQGQGQVVLSAAAFPFTNLGLKQMGNPPLVLNLARLAGVSGVVWFDEWHHGVRAGDLERVGPANWLRYTPPGHALLYMTGLLLLVLILGGQHFGRPARAPAELSRRGPLEYVTAMAHLSRRAGHRAEMLRHYHEAVKRRLGQRYRLDPTLRDGEYVTRLEQYNPALDAARLRRLLAQLSRRRVSESEMIQLAAEAADWMHQA